MGTVVAVVSPSAAPITSPIVLSTVVLEPFLIPLLEPGSLLTILTVSFNLNSVFEWLLLHVVFTIEMLPKVWTTDWLVLDVVSIVRNLMV